MEHVDNMGSGNIILDDFGLDAEEAINAGDSQKSKKKKEKENSGGGIITGVVLLILTAVIGIFVFSTFVGAGSSQALTAPEYSSEFLASAIGPDSPASPPGTDWTRHIVYRDGSLFVRGVASSQGVIVETIAELESVFGEGNVVAEIVIDSDFPDELNTGTSVFFADTVLFESGSSVVAPQFSTVLGASVAFLELSPETTIEITGHTDSNGDERSNLILSQARVDAARDVMINEGGDEARISAVGLGESAPMGDNNTAEGRALNRRVELTVTTG